MEGSLLDADDIQLNNYEEIVRHVLQSRNIQVCFPLSLSQSSVGFCDKLNEPQQLPPGAFTDADIAEMFSLYQMAAMVLI